MKVKVPHDLVMKFLEYEGLESSVDERTIIDDHGIKKYIVGEIFYKITLDLSLEPRLLRACIEWNRIIETYFKTSYKAARFDIGPYEGIWPCEIRPDGVVIFRVDSVHDHKHNWREWFIKEDLEYASQ